MRKLAMNLVDTALSPKIIGLDTIRISWFLGYFSVVLAFQRILWRAGRY